MPSKEIFKSKSLNILFLVTLALSIQIQSSLAYEPPKIQKNQNQPSLPASSEAAEQPKAEAPKEHLVESSLDFLATNSTISPTAPNIPKPEGSDEVAFLLSEECNEKDTGTAGGTTSCQRVYSNGHRASVTTQFSDEGDQQKRQTVIEEFDRDGTLIQRKTIRHRLDYNYRQDQKAKEKELFDITYQPVEKAATRELMVYEYSLETGKTRSLSWTQYKQTTNSAWAGLTFHASLKYGEDGQPERGIAESWDHGKKAETFMNWNRLATGYVLWDKDSWEHWEGWIRNVSLQAYLP